MLGPVPVPGSHEVVLVKSFPEVPGHDGGRVGDRTPVFSSILFFPISLHLLSLFSSWENRRKDCRPVRTRDSGNFDSVTQESVYKAYYGGEGGIGAV